MVVDEVGYGIPVQELFDLVVGSGMGGVTALGLFKVDWSIENALKQFTDLCQSSFSRRLFLQVPGFRHPAQMLFSYRYKTEGVEKALKERFGEESLFGQPKDARSDSVKVGVVAAMHSRKRPFLFTNYSRNPTTGKFSSNSFKITHSPNIDDVLQRADDRKDDLLSWEA
jgi:patatin-like phospholipase/acyl hydrolase